MIIVRANARNATYISDDLITSGSVGIPVTFNLSEDFDGLSAIAVFEGSGTARDVALMGNTCVVPHEVLATAGGYLRIGVYASNSAGTIVIPTVWAGSKMILQGTEPSEVDPSEPTPSWAAQVQAAAAEALETANNVLDMTVEADTLPAGSEATVEKSVDPDTGAVTLEFGIPRGEQGVQGEQGIPGKSGVYVGSEEPTDPDVNVWIDPDGSPYDFDAGSIAYDSENEYPDGSVGQGINDLKSHLEQIEKGYTPLNASDIIQGSFDVYGNIRQNSKRIRNSGMIDIKAGDTLFFTPGQTVKTILYGLFTTTGAYVSDNGWYPGLEKTFTEDCKIICVFENGLGTDLTPEEYDATTWIVHPISENVRMYVTPVSEKVDTMYSIGNYFDVANSEYHDSTMLGNGTITSNQDYDVFYIDLGSVKTSIYMTGAWELMTFRYYNASGGSISAAQFYVDKGPREMSLPTGTRFIRFGCKKVYQPYFMVTDAPTYVYTPHYDLNTVVLNAAQNWWAGKIGDSLGDSLTEQRFFQLYTKKYFGLDKFYIHGIGGTKMSGPANQYGDSMWMDSRINALSTDADFVTVLGGQNDGNVAIGDISKSNTDTDTYAGALNTVINKIYAHCKAGVAIILCTPFYVPSEGAGGERFAKFDEAVRGIAKLHGLPVADFGGLGTADENTADLYWGTDRTHPIEKFYREKIAPILISTMENIRPVDWDRINNYGKFIDGIQYLP